MFLEGCHEPTLAILYEEEQACTGRLFEVKDTVTLLMISIDVINRQFPVIFSLPRLPYDSLRVYAVPKPIGGVLIAGVNQVIHADQGSRGTGVGVNGLTPLTTQMQFSMQRELSLSLERAEGVFLDANRFLWLLMSGELWVMTMRKEGRTVTDFRFDRAGLTTLPSCAVLFMNQYVFVGSRTGDSILLKASRVVHASLQQQQRRKVLPFSTVLDNLH